MYHHRGNAPIVVRSRGVLAMVFLCSILMAAAQRPDDAQKLLLSGRYDDCIRLCEKVTPIGYVDEDWPILQAKALLAIGRYPEAEATVSNALAKLPHSVRLRLIGVDTANFSGNTNLSSQRLEEIDQSLGTRPWLYRDPQNIIALGRAALLMGLDARMVLERFFNTAQKLAPELRETYLASGELALDKGDFALAARTFSDGTTRFPTDPDLLYGLARAYEPNARPAMLDLIDKALTANTNHLPSMLLLADHLINAERYDDADEILERALKVNPWHPDAWAYRAVLAHLRNDAAAESAARDKGLHFWNTNPRVDHLIGLKLSEDYRFSEGADYQRRALAFNPQFEPARIQLAEDLLRLGEEQEGWQLAEDAHRDDGYDVTAYNLVTLRRTMEKFATLTNDHFMLRMSTNEAALYGERALALLENARNRLTAKYGVALDRKITIEIFPEQKDFGVRTFGLPHNPGFLGVCFGNVVTANSPAAQGADPANWEAVLWHEFTHVITLNLTRNKMPRWLSEGISVYEELQCNPAWGQQINPQYRDMILTGDLTPVSELSSAFISPKTPLHIQFAYYQSALVVEFLVQQFGFDKLRAILADLAEGAEINATLEKHIAPMTRIDKEFTAYATAKAEALGPALDWQKPAGLRGLMDAPSGERPSSPRRVDSGENPSVEGSTNRQFRLPPNILARMMGRNLPTNNYYLLMQQAKQAIAEQQWDMAKAPLQTIADNCPDLSGPNSPWALLARVHRELKETDHEIAALEKWASLDADAMDAYERLVELAAEKTDWPVVAQNAERFLAVQPLLPEPYRFVARASEALGDIPRAIASYEKLLLLDPPDPADVHFRVATLLHSNKKPDAKRHVLKALEEAPRYRDAHRLLLEISDAQPVVTNTP